MLRNIPVLILGVVLTAHIVGIFILLGVLD
mgnify:CR=1 FL=1|jgi:hypothetical protein